MTERSRKSGEQQADMLFPEKRNAEKSSGCEFDDFQHLPLAGTDPPFCVELPADYWRCRRVLLDLARIDLRILCSETWRSLVGLEAAVTAFEAGRPDELGTLIYRVPALLKHYPALLDLFVGDINRRDHHLLRAVWENLPRRPTVDHRTVELRRQVVVLREASQAAARGTPTWLPTLGKVVSVPENREVQIDEVARSIAEGDDTGFETKTRAFARVHQADRRVGAKAARFNALFVPCTDHTGAGALIDVEPHSYWNEPTATLATVEEVENATVLDIMTISKIPVTLQPGLYKISVDANAVSIEPLPPEHDK